MHAHTHTELYISVRPDEIFGTSCYQTWYGDASLWAGGGGGGGGGGDFTMQGDKPCLQPNFVDGRSPQAKMSNKNCCVQGQSHSKH